MSQRLKRKYREVRQQFKRELFLAARQNAALAMMIVETYVASQHRKHIGEIWYLLGTSHKEAYRDYCDKLMGKTLTGRDEIFKSLYFADRGLYNDYHLKIPEAYAMGDALAVAYKVLQPKK